MVEISSGLVPPHHGPRAPHILETIYFYIVTFSEKNILDTLHVIIWVFTVQY
jgi:hypothetical protein